MEYLKEKNTKYRASDRRDLVGGTSLIRGQSLVRTVSQIEKFRDSEREKNLITEASRQSHKQSD